MEPLKHECGVAMIRLLKPLEYYQQKYVFTDDLMAAFGFLAPKATIANPAILNVTNNLLFITIIVLCLDIYHIHKR